MAKKIVLSGTMKELKINDKGCVPVLGPGTQLVEGSITEVVGMAHNKSDLKITIEAVQPRFFDDDDDSEGAE